MFFVWLFLNIVFIITGVFLIKDSILIGSLLIGVGVFLMFLWVYFYSKKRRKRKEEGDNCALDGLFIDSPEALFSSFGKKGKLDCDCSDGDCGGVDCAP